MPINWDGSYLGKYPDSIVVAQAVSGNNKYCRIELPRDNGSTETIYCGFRTLINTDPLIIDEMKPLFGLEKMGTHWIEIGSYKYFIYRVPIYIDPNNTNIKKIQEEFTLDQIYINDPIFRKEVQKIFAFREALGIRMSYESSIRVRVEKSLDGQRDIVRPISFREPSILCNKDSAIPKTIINRWFDTTSVASLLKSMIGMSTLSPTTTIVTFRQKVEDIINRVDKDKIYYSSNFLERIFTRILV